MKGFFTVLAVVNGAIAVVLLFTLHYPDPKLFFAYAHQALAALWVIAARLQAAHHVQGSTE